MKKVFVFAVSFLLVIGLLTAHAVRAEEGESAKSDAPKAAESDTKKAPEKGGEGGEGGEGGKKSKGPEDVSGGRFAGDPVYVHLAPLVMPVITSNGAEQIVTMQIDVEVKDFDVADNIHSNMPRVRDALMRALYGGLGDGTLRQGKLVNVDKIKRKAAKAISEVVGVEGVRDVLIQGIAQRIF